MLDGENDKSVFHRVGEVFEASKVELSPGRLGLIGPSCCYGSFGGREITEFSEI